MSRHRFARALALLSAGLLSAGVLVTGVLIGPASPAQAGSLGAVTLSQQEGSVTDTPMFATASSPACPTGYGENASLRIGQPNAEYSNLARSLGGGGFDLAPLEFAADRSFTMSLGNTPPPDGEWWVIVECYSLTLGRHVDQFQTSIMVCGESWGVGTPEEQPTICTSSAAETRTSVSVEQADENGRVPAGIPVTLTADVCVPSGPDDCEALPATASGRVVFSGDVHNTAEPPTVFGEADVTDGRATLSGIDLTQPGGGIPTLGYQILARFETESAEFRASTAEPVDIVIYLGDAPAVNTVTKLTTTPASPLSAGVTLVLSATVNPAAGTTEPVGKVRFEQRTATNLPWVVLGTADLAEGKYTHTVNTRLPDGTYSLQAVFEPTVPADFNTSTDAVNGYIVGEPQTGPVATTTTLGVNLASPQQAGTELTLTATVVPSAATGTVQFLDGTAVIGSVPVSNGQATVKTSNLATGTHQLKAKFTPATAAYGASESAVTSYVITAASDDGDNGDNGDDGDDGGDGAGGGSLAQTGAPLIMIGSAGLLLVGVGGGTMLVTRRRVEPEPVAWPDGNR